MMAEFKGVGVLLAIQQVSQYVRRRPLASWTAAAVGAGLCLGWLGPFGSYLNDGWALRLLYWTACMLVALLIYGGAVTLAKKPTQFWGRDNWLVVLGAVMIVSVPQALITRAAAFWIWPDLAALNLPLWQWFAQTLTLSMFIFGVIRVRRLWTSAHGEVKTTSYAKPAAAVGTLPKDVLALQMEDHYVRVHTPSGKQLILMPMHMAIDAVAVEGLRTHRSWWVARHAVVEVHGSPRSMRLQLSNGVFAPVARSAVAELRQNGWLSKTAAENLKAS